MIDVIGYLTEMSTVRGIQNKICKTDFTFFFSAKDNNPHGIRSKISWNRNRMTDFGGYMMLHGDYKYISNSNSDSKFISANEEAKARKFFKEYKVLFAAVWEGYIGSNDVYKFFIGKLSFADLVEIMGIDSIRIKNVEDLEKYVREHNLFNMND